MELKPAVSRALVLSIFTLSLIAGCGGSGGGDSSGRPHVPPELEKVGITSPLRGPASGKFAPPPKPAKVKGKAVKPAPAKPAP
jgi:hypothetical protein